MKIEIPEVKKLVFEMRFPVRWGDMDAMGHVNNTVYFRCLETARIEWIVSVGCNPDPRGQGPVIVNAFCNFYKQLEYPADVLLKLYVRDLGHHGAHGPARRDLRGRWRHHHLGGLPAAEGSALAGLDAGAGLCGLNLSEIGL